VLSGGALSGAVLIVDDPFTDGGTGNGADALDIAWASNGGTGSFGIVDDAAGIGTGNALDRASTGTFVGIRGTFGSPVSINSVGDFITFSSISGSRTWPATTARGFASRWARLPVRMPSPSRPEVRRRQPVLQSQRKHGRRRPGGPGRPEHDDVRGQ
jgi:hypothetical protein